MNDWNKPPLGAAPGYIRACARIKELADAISRLAESPEGQRHPGRINMWAEEIMLQVTIMRATLETDKQVAEGKY